MFLVKMICIGGLKGTYRKREVMLKRGKSILTLICLYLKLRKERAAIGSGLLESGDTRVSRCCFVVA